MAQPNVEQSLSLRDQFMGPESDQGFFSIGEFFARKGAKAFTRVGSLALIAAAGFAVSAGGYAREHPATNTVTTVGGGHGEVTRIGTLPFPETYYGIVEDTVSGVTASADNELFGFSISNKATVKLKKSKYTMKIGNPPLDVNYAPGENGKKVSVKFPLDNLLATVYQTDPTKSGMENDNGFVMSGFANSENIINSIGNLKSNSVNEVYQHLSGLVLLDAYKISVETCAPNAWSYLQPIYFKDLAEYTAKQLSVMTPKDPLTAADVEIIPEGEPKFTSQYQQQFDALTSRNEANGDKFKVNTDTSKVECNVNESVIKETASAGAGSK